MKAMDKGSSPWSCGRGSGATGGWAMGGAAAKTGGAAGCCTRDRGGAGASGVAWDRGNTGATDAGGARPRCDVRAKGAGGMAVDDGARGCAISLFVVLTGQSTDWSPMCCVMAGHTRAVSSVAFSHDGKCVVSGSYDETVRICDAETGENMSMPLEGHMAGVRSVAFSRDGKRVVSGSRDNTVRI